jgi:hypothetical protein
VDRAVIHVLRRQNLARVNLNLSRGGVGKKNPDPSSASPGKRRLSVIEGSQLSKKKLFVMMIPVHNEERAVAVVARLIGQGRTFEFRKLSDRYEVVTEDAFELPEYECPRCRAAFSDLDSLGVIPQHETTLSGEREYCQGSGKQPLTPSRKTAESIWNRLRQRPNKSQTKMEWVETEIMKIEREVAKAMSGNL